MVWEINAVVGPPGSGKTLFMVYVMHFLDKSGKPFITNVNTTFKNAVYIENPLSLFELAETGNYQYAFIDELWLWLDSRFSASKRNREFTRFANQIRKYDMTLYHTLQNFYNIDVRLRALTTYIIIPKYDERTDIMKVIITDPDATFMKTVKLRRMSQYFKYYNTRQKYVVKDETFKNESLEGDNDEG